MIDLRNKGLPNALVVQGKPFPIYTDFRKWLKFGGLAEDESTLITELLFVSKCDIPEELYADWFRSAIDFYLSKNSTPNFKRDADKVVDFIEDGAYIVSSFYHIYNVDLTICEMHWQLFKSLFDGLPENCKMREIMQYRAYSKSSKTQDKVSKELKYGWKLPQKYTKEEQKKIDEFNNL